MTTPLRDSQSAAKIADATPPAGGSRRWLNASLVALFVGVLGVLAWQWYLQQPPQRFRRALTALDRNDLPGVRRELNGWPTSAEFEPHRHFLTGAILFREGKLPLALREFERSVNHPEVRVRTLTLTGGAIYQMGSPVQAINLFVQALEFDENAVDAHRWLGSCYYDLGVNQRALEHLTRAAELDLIDPRPHRLVGLMHKDFEHYPEAIAAYEESLQRSQSQPDVNEIRIELAECQIKMRQYDRALAQLGQCAADPARKTLEAECWRATGESDRAFALVDEALVAEPKNLKALILKGTARLEDGDAQDAVKWLGQAVEFHPHDYPARFKYSQALQRAGQTDEAAEQARIANDTKKLYEEFTAQHALADKEPRNSAIRYELGLTALQLGRPDLAVNWFRMTLALEPNHVEALRELQKLSDSSRRPPNSTPQPSNR